MRIAILSDIHGNSIALDAVLADIAAQGGVDNHWFVGDLVAIGIDPIGVIERIEGLPNAICTSGNSDQYLLNGIGDNSPDPKPTNEAEWRHQVEISRAFGWTTGMLWSARKHHFLQALPFEHRLTLPDGTDVLLTHASPGKIDGPGIRPSYSEADLSQLMAGADADLVIVGHTHWPMNRLIDSVHLVNLGCVGNNNRPLTQAQYVILEADERGYTIEHRYVEYDREACVAFCEKDAFPGADFVAKIGRGEFRPKWYDDFSSAELEALIPPANIKLPRPTPVSNKTE